MHVSVSVLNRQLLKQHFFFLFNFFKLNQDNITVDSMLINMTVWGFYFDNVLTIGFDPLISMTNYRVTHFYRLLLRKQSQFKSFLPPLEAYISEKYLQCNNMLFYDDHFRQQENTQ